MVYPQNHIVSFLPFGFEKERYIIQNCVNLMNGSIYAEKNEKEKEKGKIDQRLQICSRAYEALLMTKAMLRSSDTRTGTRI